MANTIKTLLVPNELFRFASVRAINTHSAEALERRFIPLSKDSDVNKIKKQYSNNQFLFFNINQYKSNSPERLQALVEQQKQTSTFIIKPDQFEKEYPHNFDSVYAWQRSSDKVNFNSLLTELNQALGQNVKNSDAPIKAFLNGKAYQDKKFKLYETLVAYYLDPEPEYFLDLINNRIRWFWLLQRISMPDNDFARQLPDEAQAIQEALNATIILPFETGYSKKEVDAKGSQNNLNKADADIETARKRLETLTRAADEISEKYEVQLIDETHLAKHHEDCNKGANFINSARNPKGSLLESRYVKGLSEDTHSVIDSYRIPKVDGLDLSHIAERINAEKRNIVSRHFPPPKSPIVININGRFMEMSQPCTPYQYDPCATYPLLPIQYQKIPMRTPGWADLKVIKSTLLKYTKGEIAHIENVLKGEVKIREFNVTKRNEESLVTEEEITSELDKETQSTDRFELEKELSTQSKEDMKFDTGVKVSAKLGPVQLDTHLDFTYNKSKEESNKTATKNAQEMVNRALSKVIERKKTQKTVTTIITTEDKNSHTLKNDTSPNDNIHGMYFWVDKHYLAKVVNYGSRFMLEFMVPEPAAYYLYSKTNKPQPVNAKVRPDFPQIQDPSGSYRDIKSFVEITEDNYAQLAAKYDAQDVLTPDPSIKVLASSFKFESQEFKFKHRPSDDDEITAYPVSMAVRELLVPSGYLADKGYVTIAGSGVNLIKEDISILLGKIKRDNADFNYTLEFFPLSDSVDEMTREDGVVPFAIWAASRHELVANVEIICRKTEKNVLDWKKVTFNSIMNGYHKQLKEYEDWQASQEVGSGISIQGNNPEMNRQVEREELKKLCIELMTGQFFQSFNAVNNNVPPLGYPEIIPNKAFEEGKHIQFFEQAFEWEQMTYVFYPYFWGRKPNWVMIKSINDTDPIFTHFLQAGAARILVPARPGFEYSVVYFLANQQIWNGSNPPIPGDPLWVSIVDELKAQQGQTVGGNEEGTPWLYKVPTSLVYLEATTFKLEDTDSSQDYPKDLQQIEDAKTSADFN